MLANGGDSLPISANAQFTFATQIASRVAYSVAISTQPLNPSQNCVIKNGSGTMGSGNVTNISVVCTTPNLANAKLTGTYKVVSFEYPSPFDYGYTGDFSDLLTLSFDGAGNFSGTDVQAGDGTVVSGAVSGTYTVTTAGTFTLSPMGRSTMSGAVSVNGNTLVAAQTTSGFEPSLVFGIKQGQTNFSNANLAGTYTTVRFGYHGAGDSSGLSTVTFDGAGNFSGSDAVNNAGTVSSTTVAGTYTVAADGTLILLGRGSHVINSGGEKIFPEEVEEAVKRVPGVLDCLVVGVDDERFGQAVAAVAATDGRTVDEAEVIAHVNTQLARYKAPKRVVFVGEVPRSPNGKADYAKAKQYVLDADTPDPDPLDAADPK
jgi:hypothetical protein